MARYIVLGILTFFLATAIFFLVPDTPMEARFLSNQEKVSHLEHVKVNQTGIESRKAFSLKQLREAFTDLQLWLQWLVMLLNGGGGGVITTYSATLIYSFGYTPQRAALLNMGGGAVGIVTCLSAAYGSKYFGNRWLFLISVTLPTITGAGLMAYSPSTSKTALLAGIYLVNCSIACVPIQFAWLTTNVAGHTKKTCAFAVLNAAFALGNIMGPQTFQARDAPEYIPAKTAMMAFQCAIVAVAICLFGYYKFENKKRDKEATAAGEDIAESTAYGGLTDKENRRFRYAY